MTGSAPFFLLFMLGLSLLFAAGLIVVYSFGCAFLLFRLGLLGPRPHG